MVLLLLGLALFAGLHLFKTPLRPARAAIVARIGEGAWKGLVAVGLVLSIFLMARGYASASAAVLWVAPTWFNAVVILGMMAAFVLFFGSYPGSALRARLRHPQLTGVKIWAVLHLLANGDVRSLVLFGGLLAWAVAEVILINRRDGKPPLPPASGSAAKAWAAVPIGLLVWALVLVAHPVLFGVSPLG